MENTCDTMFSQLSLLNSAGKLTEQEWAGVEAMKDNASILTMLYEAKKKEIDGVVAEEEIKKKQEDCFKDTFDITKYEGVSDLNGCKVIKSLGFYVGLGNMKVDGEKIAIHRIDSKLMPYITKLILDDKARVEKEWIEANKPKPTKKSGGKRGAFKGEVRVINTEETAEGKDFPFYFKGDEDATFTKPTFTAKDGSYQNHKIKAVKNNSYMGGNKSDENDGVCVGAVIWDRAIGSNAIKSTGLSPAQFRIRCSKDATNGDMCAKCNGRNPSFFAGTYQLGAKSKGSVYNGLTYCKFIQDHLEYSGDAEQNINVD
jgi:hypothetical protein